MRPVLLHLDEALTVQGRLRRAAMQSGGLVLDYRDLGPPLRLWARPQVLGRLEQRTAAALPAAGGPALVFGGSGDFHHVTALLVQRAIAGAAASGVTVLHFDNHPDWVRFSPGLHCGSWVGQVARLPGVARVLTIGPCSADLKNPQRKRADLDLVAEGRVEVLAYRAPDFGDRFNAGGQSWPTIESMGEAAFATHLASRICGDAIYVTIDKDVLHPADAGTNWDQGQLRLRGLVGLLEAAVAGRRLIGADVFGDWSPPRYGGGPLAVALKAGEALLDQPWRAPGAAHRHNEDVNLELLNVLRKGLA